MLTDSKYIKYVIKRMFVIINNVNGWLQFFFIFFFVTHHYIMGLNYIQKKTKIGEKKNMSFLYFYIRKKIIE